MKNILKRNQIIIFVIALMLVSAGYLNYSGNKTNNELLETGLQIISEDETEFAGIGDAKLVNSNLVEDNGEQVDIPQNENNSDVDNTSNGNTSENQKIGDSYNNEVDTLKNNTSSKEIQEYFSSSRLNRETMYSQMLETYKKILESQTISETQKSIAQTEIQNINNTKNKIMICENLIKTKGFNDLIIFVNDKSISVVVSADVLEKEQIAQIQNIISREMEAELTDIHISNINEGAIE